MVLSDLEVLVLDELGSGLKFLLGSPQLVPEVSPGWSKFNAREIMASLPQGKLSEQL